MVLRGKLINKMKPFKMIMLNEERIRKPWKIWIMYTKINSKHSYISLS